MTAHLTAVNAGDGDDGTIEEAQARAIAAAVAAVRDTMTAIGELKEAEGLSDTVVDAIEILENAWAELGEVQLGGTPVSDIDAEDENAIEGVTQEQVGILKEDKDIDYTVN